MIGKNKTKETKTGDFEELTLHGKEYAVIDEICCSQYDCIHDEPLYREGCYLLKARHRAEMADIIIVNHSLLIYDAIGENQLIPDYQYLIIDEAQHLEKVATNSLTFSFSISSLTKPFEKLLRLIASLNKKTDGLRKTAKDFQTLSSRIHIFFGLLGIFMEKSMEPYEFQYQVTITPESTNTLEWSKVKESAKAIIESGKQLLQKIKNEIKTMEDAPKNHLKEISYNISECEKKLSDLGEIFEADSDNRINWLFKTSESGAILKSAPVNIGMYIQPLLYEAKESIILTSATLTIDKSFDFIREQLSLDDSFEGLSLPSHFDFPDQVKIIVAENLPPPGTEGYFKSSADLIAEIIRKNNGQTLVLFTSKRALSATYMEVASSLQEESYRILAQGVTGGRGKILEHFKTEPEKSAIFGLESFWQGVDIPENMITCVVIQKLPFDPPSDPIISARSQKYMNSFSEFQLPQAILKFKQGFGRLIRNSKDKGCIVVLDTRIVQKSYGIHFLKSLPEGIRIEYSPKEQITDLL